MKNAYRNAVILIFLFLGFFIYHIWFQNLILNKGYELAEIKKVMKQQKLQLNILENKYSQLMSTNNLNKIVEKLKNKGILFTKASKDQVVFISKDSQVPTENIVKESEVE